ncbi:uncharacterized protein F5891DRAFT_700820 [Suillus fuscotomentosus]|uniref:VWFA domain-containing protein n=1 Tax=Suillus fuscotomentosus TaxID=1912939 RepID=A0AAD4DVP3_9AGAM|nr:uncharacterized protein F5891DRAFT_700820 [Suillus fuscotomentosus]KAG1894940.1 hypothetical protein F5891DRAFT_700820 [Suillus fuscotomentosus]
MRSSTPTQFQSTRTSMSSSTHSNPAAFGTLMPETRPAPYQQRPSYLAPRPLASQYETSQYTMTKPAYEYGRPPATSSYPPPMPAFNNDSTITTTTTTITTRHKNSWLDEARESTANFKKNGSPVPLIWILIEDKSIPPNAVPFGEDRNGQTFFIARAHLEGGLHIGKVGYHTSGALISYVGKEHLIEKYEVLVCASQLRWGLASQDATGSLAQGTVVLARQQQGRQELKRTASNLWSRETRETRESTVTSVVQTALQVDDIPRFAPSLLIQEEELRRVAEYKTVILIDDSISMAEADLWSQMREALAGIVDLAIQYGSKGIDLHFMHQTQFAENMRSRSEVQKLFDQLSPTGEDTPTGVRLEQIIEMYLPLIEHPSSTHEPISIIVITDGAATDGDDLLRCIIEAASRLDRQQVPLDKFGIQFVQIGTDEDAARALHMLDDELSERYKIRDIVDTTPFDHAHGAFNTDYMVKIFIGSLHQGTNNGTPELPLPERKPQIMPMPGYDRHPSPAPRSASPHLPASGLRARGF